MGPHGLLVECGDLDDVAALTAYLDSNADRGIVDLVPAMCTVMVLTSPGTTDDVRRLVEHAPPRGAAASTMSVKVPTRVAVDYGGPDLVSVSDRLGLSVEALVTRHTSVTWRVAFIGFAPGFAYLHCPEWSLRPVRHETPRPRVPIGSVGIADGFSGVYPKASPGGWQLVGRTSAQLWDVVRTPPTTLQPGDAVRFVDARG